METSQQHFMHRCIELALIAKRRGESPVGSVIVKDAEIIGSGIEASKAQKDITFHAEIEAIRQATGLLNSQDLSACILYTTHEPCIMCSYVIRHTKINMVVIGLPSGELGGYSSKFPLLADDAFTKWGKPPTLIFGILEKECSELHL